MARAVGLVLRSPILSPVWYRGRVYGGPLGSSGSPTHRRVDGAGRLSWDTRYHCTSRRPCCWRRQGRTVLIQGAAGAVGLCAVQLARRAGARVIGIIRSSEDETTA